MTIINVANVSDLSSTRRIDAEFFIPDGIEASEIVNNFPKVTKLGRITSWITQGPNPKFTEEGIPSLNGKNIYLGTAGADEPNFVSPQTYNALQKYTLLQNDIVITLKHATKIGRSWIITDDEPKIFSRNVGLIRLRYDSPINPASVLFYLWSHYAQKILDRLATGGTSGQITLPTSSLRTLPVPIFKKKLQNKLVNYLTKYNEMLFESKTKYQQAEKILLEEIGFKNFKFKYNLSYVDNLSKAFTVHRVDAEYFEPSYDRVLKKIMEYPNGYARLLNYVNNVKPHFNPQKYPDKTYNYIELADIDESIGVIQSESKIKGDEAPSRARRILSNNDVIVSSVEGSLEKVSLIGKEHEGSLASTGFFQFKSTNILPELLLVLSKSIILQIQLKRECTGTILTAVPNVSLKRIIIPIISDDVQQNIAYLIKKSHEARRKAKDLLKKAIKITEKAIENEIKK